MGRPRLLLTCPSRAAETQHHCSRCGRPCPAGSRTASRRLSALCVHSPGRALLLFLRLAWGNLKRYFLCPFGFPIPPPSPLPIICCLVCYKCFHFCNSFLSLFLTKVTQKTHVTFRTSGSTYRSAMGNNLYVIQNPMILW